MGFGRTDALSGARGGNVPGVRRRGEPDFAGNQPCLGLRLQRRRRTGHIGRDQRELRRIDMLAYHIATMRGCDVDQPRNLAKSVTVE